jgi:hypothetical protein
MSKLFADEKFEKLDWISQALTPWTFSINDVLSNIPDRIELSNEVITSAIDRRKDSVPRLNNDTIYKEIMKYLPDSFKSEHAKLFTLRVDDKNIFKFEITGQPVYILRTNTIEGGTIAIVKTRSMLSDQDCKNTTKDIIARNQWYNYHNNDASLQRLNEVIDILGIKKSTRRSFYYKLTNVTNYLLEVVEQDIWQIRSVDLWVKILGWINDYVFEGYLPGLINITKLKIMTHNKQPIYSIKEEE